MTKRKFDVPRLIKRIRGLMDLTQEELAHELGVTFSTVNLWQNGKRFPQPFLLKRLLELERELNKKEGKK